MRLRDINVMAMNEVTNTKDKRIRAIHVPESDRWALRIEEAKLSDEGGYECQVTTTNKTILIVYLTVLGQFYFLSTVLTAFGKSIFFLSFSYFRVIYQRTPNIVGKYILQLFWTFF